MLFVFRPWARFGSLREVCDLQNFPVLLVAFLLTINPSLPLRADETLSEQDFPTQIQPLLVQYCGDCHQGTDAEAEWDLDQYTETEHLRANLPRWVRVRQLIHSRQMPPVDATQLEPEDRAKLETWLEEFLMHEAQRYANDPGPVELRRLSNAEYNYAIQDLTGIPSLNPTAAFPEDAAVGEGFTNTGSGQGMSAAMAQKYLDAARQVSEHLVLLPDGIRFSPDQSRQDQTNRLLARIQAFYDRYTQASGATAVDLQGVRFETNSGGRLPLLRYFAAAREGLRTAPDVPSWESLAKQQDLQPKYLNLLRESLQSPSPMMQALRDRLASDQPLEPLVAEVQTAQRRLWKFHPVGQLGREGTPGHWMELNRPFVSWQEHDLTLPTDSPTEVVVASVSRAVGSVPAPISWENMRLVFPSSMGRAWELPLNHLEITRQQLPSFRADHMGRTQQYLAAVRTMFLEPDSFDASLVQNLDGRVLQRWRELVGLADAGQPVEELFQQKNENVQGYTALQGWSRDGMPNLLTNLSDQDIAFSTLSVPARGVTIHPSPERHGEIAWQSPMSGSVNIQLDLQDRDSQCGNGFGWQLELQTRGQKRILGSGRVTNGQSATFKSDSPVEVAAGDLVRAVVMSGDNDYVCDTTGIDLILQAVETADQRWQLSTDLVEAVQKSNPVPDRLGHPAVWHLGSRENRSQPRPTAVEGSLLATWRERVLARESDESMEALEREIENWLRAPASAESDSSASQNLKQKLWQVRGPLEWLRFTYLEYAESEKKDLSSVVRIPADWLQADGETMAVRMVGQTKLATTAPVDAVAQSWFQLGEPSAAAGSMNWDLPFLIHEETRDSHPFAKSLQQYAELFPLALCYRKIVPVDEVVTLTLFHREDHHLQRLMLEPSEAAELDRLWEELIYISQEPLRLVVALEQLIQFATQDRQDLVGPFQALREPVEKRAESFQQNREENQPVQVRAVIDLAHRAWRRPLTEDEENELLQFYDHLRAAELDHEASARLLLSRILAAPDFLFKLETEWPGQEARLVDNQEMASRLSFFLLSSLPDQELLDVADSGQLVSIAGDRRQLNREEILRQTRRLMGQGGAGRLAVQFGCQWLHVRGFDQQNDKNEKLFPEFADLRDDMYNETIQFFTHLLTEDRSILEMLDAEYVWLNPTLSSHYGMEEAYQQSDSTGTWRRVSPVDRNLRGGVLGMATVLASQSGASRTSPILRGNWIYETLLGQKLPNPPAGVPELPDELPVGLSARELIEKHSSDPACANCHIRIDPFGIALEQFDVLGRLRPNPDTRTRLEDGSEMEGLRGLKEYLLEKRQSDFVAQFCRKLLGFALGRPLQLSDEPLLRQMQQSLQENDYRIMAAVETLVVSPQFTMKRGQSMTSPLDP